MYGSPPIKSLEKHRGITVDHIYNYWLENGFSKATQVINLERMAKIKI